MDTRAYDGMPMILLDEEVKPVWRRWMCECGGEYCHSESLRDRYDRVEVHYCDKCHDRREDSDIYPRIAYVSVVNK